MVGVVCVCVSVISVLCFVSINSSDTLATHFSLPLWSPQKKKKKNPRAAVAGDSLHATDADSLFIHSHAAQRHDYIVEVDGWFSSAVNQGSPRTSRKRTRRALEQAGGEKKLLVRTLICASNRVKKTCEGGTVLFVSSRVGNGTDSFESSLNGSKWIRSGPRKRLRYLFFHGEWRDAPLTSSVT